MRQLMVRCYEASLLSAVCLLASCSSTSDNGAESGVDSCGDPGVEDAGQEAAVRDAANADSPADAGLTDSPGDATDGGFAPSSLAGLVAWFRADVGVTLHGTAVAMWADGSTYKNYLGPYAGQVTVKANAVGGHAALAFDGNSGLAAYATSGLDWGTADYVVAMVASATSCGGSGTVCWFWEELPDDAADVGVALAGFAGATGYSPAAIDYDNVQSPGVPYGGFHVLAAHRTGSTLEIRVDGTVTASGADAADMADIVGEPSTYVGESAIGGGSLTGAIAEIVVASGVSPQDVSNLEGYLMARYGL